MLYNAAMALMDAGIALASLKSTKVRLLRNGRKRSLPTLEDSLKDLPSGHERLWIHAASLGEFEQGLPLIEMLRRLRPDVQIVLTFFSPSGFEVRKSYDRVDAVAYLPADRPKSVRRFLDIVRPTAAIFVKYEFWANYLNELSLRGIPTYLISGIFRPSQAFFKPWGGMFRRMLRCFTRLYLQDENSAALLRGIGIDNVVVAGDTRFDRVTDIMRSAVDMPVVNSFIGGSRKVLVVGSSWPDDERFLIPWLKANPEVKAIFAPHEFDAERIQALISSLGPGHTSALSTLEQNPDSIPANLRYLIVDSFGRLATLYRKASVAYVGGGFGAGIHNINEAAVYNIPVIFGPRHDKFLEARDMIELGAAFSISDAQSLNAALSRLFADDDARLRAGNQAGAYVRSKLGATQRIFNDLFPES